MYIAPCLNPPPFKNFGCTPSNGIWNKPSDCWRTEKLLHLCIEPWALLTFGLAMSKLSTHLCFAYPGLCLALFILLFFSIFALLIQDDKLYNKMLYKNWPQSDFNKSMLLKHNFISVLSDKILVTF